MHPVKQFLDASGLKNTLFAPNGTNTKLFAALAATECAVPAGCPVPPGTLNVVTS
jgi:hypothetical protein